MYNIDPRLSIIARTHTHTRGPAETWLSDALWSDDTRSGRVYPRAADWAM